MPKRMLILAVAAACGLAAPAPTRACSVGPGYLTPSNFELVRDTEGIVLAKAVRFSGADPKLLELEVVRVLKGGVEPKTLVLVADDRWFGASDPQDFSRARPGAYTGACIAYDYKVGSLFLLFLNRRSDVWSVSGPPFTRANEEVSGADAPWVKAVVHYVRIAALEAERQKEALRVLSATAADTKSADHVPGLAADIDRHFKSPHETKSFDDLKELHDKAGDDRERSRVLWAFVNGRHPAATPFMRNLVRTGAWKRFAGPVTQYVAAVKDPTAVPAFTAALRADPGLKPRWSVLQAIGAAADDSHGADLLALLKTVTDEEAKLLLKYFIHHPRAEARAEIARRIGKEYAEKTDLTFALAALGDRDVVTWALESAKTPGEQRWVAHYALAISPLPEADRAAEEILKGSDPKAVETLVQGYGQSRSPHRVHRLLDAIELHKELRGWALRALGELSEAGDSEAAEALKRLAGKK